MKLEKSVFRYIEHELYNYRYTVQTIQELRESIIDAVPLKETVPGTGYISDPTARKATKLVTNTALARMTRTVAAIERALDKLKQDHRALFELKYCRAIPWKRICDEMAISERTYFRLRRELVYMVALEMGLAESWQE